MLNEGILIPPEPFRFTFVSEELRQDFQLSQGFVAFFHVVLYFIEEVLDKLPQLSL